MDLISSDQAWKILPVADVQVGVVQGDTVIIAVGQSIEIGPGDPGIQLFQLWFELFPVTSLRHAPRRDRPQPRQGFPTLPFQLGAGRSQQGRNIRFTP